MVLPLVFSTLGAASASAAAATNIQASGRTQTVVTTNGGVTDITTSTVRGNVAFNDFIHFQVGSGHVANLHLSGGAESLVNLVKNQVRIDGTLNSLYESGKIGGNVYFASPAGFVVGAQGVINVGALTVTTPTQAAMDAVFEGGDINMDAAEAIMQGAAPQEAGAVISIEGEVNALNAVTLNASTIEVAGDIRVGEAAVTAINLDGYEAASELIEDGDAIHLVGRDLVEVDGSLTADRADGEILITATKVVEVDSGIASAEAVVEISGEVTGGDIVARAVAKAGSQFDDAAAEQGHELTVVDAAGLSVLDLLEHGVDLSGGEAELGLVLAEADARVIVRDGATLDAGHDLTLEAQAERIAKTPALKTKPDVQDAFSVAAVLGAVTGETEVRVENGAQVKAGDELAIQAKSVNQVDVQATSVTAKEDGYLALTLALGIADVDTKAQVDAGAVLDSGGNVRISAHNANTFGVEATAKAVGDAAVGGAVALSYFNTAADAELAADLDAGQVAGDLVIDARSHTSQNLVSAKTTTGKAPTSALKKIKTASNKLNSLVQSSQQKAEQKANKAAGGGDQDPGQSVKLSSALALSFNDHSATARIADDTKVNVGGDLVVNAQVKSEGVRNIAESLVATQARKNDGLITGSAALALGIFQHNAEAVVGRRAELSAERIGVNAGSELPLTMSWFKWETEESLFENLKENIEGKTSADLGLPEQVFTSHAQATGKAEELGFVGALSYFESENQARAWVGDEAKLTSRATVADDAAWRTELGDGFDIDWQDVVSVQAKTTSESINVTGNYKLLGLHGTGGGQEAATVGGAFNWVRYENTAEAGIGAGVTVEADGLAVDAHSRDWMLTVTPSAGKGTSIAGNGIFALNQIDNRTRASISHDATVQARRLSLDAYQELSVWSMGGALAQGEGVSTAASIAANDVRTDTRAFIGDNSDDADENPERQGGGQIRADVVHVEAASDGQVVSVAVAGATTKSSEPKAKGSGESDTGFVGKIKNLLSLKSKKASDQANAKLDDSSVVNKAGGELDKQQTAQGEPSGPQKQQTKPVFGLSISGAATATIAAQDTQAYIDGLTIEAYSADQRTDLSVQAKNDTDLISVGGAAAFSRANKQSVEYHAAVAGAASFNVINNNTYAGLRHVTAEQAGDVAVRALNAGESVAIGIAPALDVSGQGEGGSAAASVSISWIEGGTRAEVADSHLDGQGDLEITAYDRAQTVTGGGAINAGKGKLGLGLSLSLARAAKETVAVLTDSELDGFEDVDVRALSASRLVSAAGNIGATKDGNVLVGSFVFNELADTVRAKVSASTLAGIGGDIDVLAASSSGEQTLDELIGAPRERAESTLDPGEKPEEGDNTVIEDPRFSADRGGALVIGVAGTGAGGGNAAGISVVANKVLNQHEAVLEGSQVEADGRVAVRARDAAQVIGVAVGVAGAKDTYSGMGSVVGNIAAGGVTARVGELNAAGHTTTIRASGLDVTAHNGTELWAGAGNVAAGGGEVAAGAAVAFNATYDIDADDQDEAQRLTQAAVANSRLELGDSGALTIDASNTSRLGAISVSGVGSGGLALGGSLSFNLIHDAIDARVVGSEVEADQVTVLARDRDDENGTRSSIFALAGNVVGSKGQAAVGAAFAINTIDSSVEALVEDSTLTVGGDTQVAAESGSEIISIAVAGSGANNTAAGISSTINTITKQVQARVANSRIEDGDASGNLLVRAGDRWHDGLNGTSIWSLAGNVSGAGQVAAGLASAVNTITNELTAEIEDSAVELDGAVKVQADSGSEIRAAAAAGGGAGSGAVQGSFAANTITNTTRARLSGGSVHAEALEVSAAERHDGRGVRTSIMTLAGNAQGAGSNAVGAAVAVNTVLSQLDARVEDSNDLVVTGDTEIRADTGAEIYAAAAGGGGAGSVAAGASMVANTIAREVTATLINSTLTDGAGGAGSLSVKVRDRFADGVHGSRIWALAGNVQGAGSSAVGGAMAVNTITNAEAARDVIDTIDNGGVLALFEGGDDPVESDKPEADLEAAGMLAARIIDSDVNVGGALRVETDVGSEIKSAAVAGGGAGSAAVMGSVTINTIANRSRAAIEGGSVKAGEVIVEARERGSGSDPLYVRSSIWSLAGAVGGAGSGAVNVAVAVNTIANSLEAEIDDATVEADGNLRVEVATGADIKAAAAGGGGAGSAAITGSVTVNTIANQALARVKDAEIRAANVYVQANDRIHGFMEVLGSAGSVIWSVAGSAQGAGAASVGVASAVNTISNTLAADVVDSELDVIDEVSVNAHSGAEIRAGAVGGGGAGTAQVQGSTTINTIANTTRALVKGSEVKAGALTVEARERDDNAGAYYNDTDTDDFDNPLSLRSSIWSLAGAVGGAGTAAANGALAVNTVSNRLEAVVEDADIDLGGDLTVEVAPGAEIRSVAVSVGGAGAAAVNGSSTINTITNDAVAAVRRARIDADRVYVRALDRIGPNAGLFAGHAGSSIWSMAGNVSGAGAAAIGGASAVNTIANTLAAEIIDSDLAVTDTVTVETDSGSEIISAAASGGGAGPAAVFGSTAVNTIVNTSHAGIQGGSVQAGGVQVAAREQFDGHRSKIWSGAGSVSGAGAAAIGLATAVNTVANDLLAQVTDADLSVDGAVSVDVDAGAEIRALAASGGGAGPASITGAVTVNTIANHSEASITGGSVRAADLRVRARDQMADGSAGSSIWSLAGAANGAGVAALGAASAANTVTNTLAAGIDGAALTVTGLTDVSAKEKAEIITASIGGGVAGAVAAGASASVNNIANTVSAGISNSRSDSDEGTTLITASDESSIDSLAGALRGAAGGGLAGAAAVNRIGNTIDAYFSGNRDNKDYEARNLVLRADSSARIGTLAAGGAGGAVAGLAGSVATNIVETEVRARIDQGARVLARNNVGVLAHSRDTIEVGAGAMGIGLGVVGGAASSVVNVIDSRTLAYISGANTRVTALAQDANDPLRFRGGALVNTPNMGEEPSRDSFDWYDLEGEERTVHGLAVNAFSTQQVGSLVGTVGGSGNGVGIAGTGAVHVLAGETAAWVHDATINGDGDNPGSAQTVDIQAASYSYASSFGVGAAVGASGGLGGALNSITISRLTRAELKGADVNAEDAVQVQARSGQGAQATGVSLGGGMMGGAGVGNVAVFSGTTRAVVEDSDISAHRLDVEALSRAGMNLLSGSAAAGSNAVGASLSVAVNDHTTEAIVRGGSATLDGPARVNADSDTQFWNLAVSGAVGGIGLSGMAAVNVVSNTTQALLENADLQAGSLDLGAKDTVAVESDAGALAVGGRGDGAASNVTVVQSRVTSEARNSNLRTSGELKVNAESEIQARHVTASLGAGVAEGLSSAASLILVGNGDRGEADTELSSILAAVHTLASGDKTSADQNDGLTDESRQAFDDAQNLDELNESRNALGTRGDRLARGGQIGDGLSEAELGRVNAEARYDVDGHFSAGDTHVTRAVVEGGQVEAGQLSVEAVSRVGTNNVAGAAGAGFSTLGVGGAVAITRVYGDIEARLAADETLADTVSVVAQALNLNDFTAHALAFAGGAGPVGLGAAWADAYLENTVNATLDGTVTADALVTVGAEDGGAVHAEAIGAAAGAGAVGGVAAKAGKEGDVEALVAGAAQVWTTGGLDVTADSNGAVYAKAQGAAGGLAASGTAAAAVAKDSTGVRALLGPNAQIYGGERILIQAGAQPRVGAEAEGVSVAAGDSVGASIAQADVQTEVKAVVADGVVAEAKDIIVLGRALRPASGHTAEATAKAGAAAVVHGTTAAKAAAESVNQVLSQVMEGAALRARGTVRVSAVNESSQKAYATGAALASLSEGANIAVARSDAQTLAVISGRIEGQRMVRVYDPDQAGYVYVPLAEFTADYEAADVPLVYTPGVNEAEGQLVRLYDADEGRYYYVTLEAYNRANPDPEYLAALYDNDFEGEVTVDPGAGPDPVDAYAPPALDFVTTTVELSAAGEDRNLAQAVSGSGGVLAGAAAAANTSTRSNTRALLESTGASGPLQAGAVRVAAGHTSDFDGTADSVLAAVEGGSGAIVQHQVEAETDAEIGNGTKIETFDLVIEAQGKVVKNRTGGFNAEASSGGMANGAAAGSYSTIKQLTRALVGGDARLDVIGDIRNPGRLDLVALNEIHARDRVKLDTGGGIAVALAESKVKVTESEATVSVGENAELDSVGDILLSARTQADISTKANAKTYGGASAARADSNAYIKARENVSVAQGASLLSGGNIRLYAGRDKGEQRNAITVQANSDAWNRTALPITLIDAKGEIDQAADVSIAEGARLRSVRDIYLYANDGLLAASGKAVGKDLYRKVLKEQGKLGKAIKDNELSLEINKGSGTVTSATRVRLDGHAESGIRHYQAITLDFVDGTPVCGENGCLYDEDDPPEVLISGSTEGIGYRIYSASLTQSLADRLEQLTRLRLEYEGDSELVGIYENEISRIKQQLKELGAQYIEKDGTVVVVADIIARFIELDPVVAAPGDILVEGERFEGTGHLIAPGDARIEVINNTPYFLRINGLEIPETGGGRVLFNGGEVKSNQELNELQGAGAAFKTFQTAGDSPEPYILVENTFNSDTTPNGFKVVKPDIYIYGDVQNLLGEVQLVSAGGSVISQADIRAKTISISAGRDFVLGYTEGFRHIGPDPRAEWEAFIKDFLRKVNHGEYRLSEDGNYYQELVSKVCVNEFQGICFEWESEWGELKPVPTMLPRETESVQVAGNNVFVSARYLNINGTLQSGIPDWNIDLSGLESAIDEAKRLYQQRKASGNSDPYIELKSWHGGRVKAWWNGELERIELDGIQVEGGYMELFGEIMSTGGGKLKVLDGYGRIDIQNPTGYDLMVRTLDVGRGVEGTIKITDLGQKISRDGQEHYLVTVYKRKDGQVHVYTNEEVDAYGNPSHLAGTGGERSASYAPADGLWYQWVKGQRTGTKTRRYFEETVPVLFDLFSLGWLFGTDYSDYTKQWTWKIDKQPLLEGEYLSRNLDRGGKFLRETRSKHLSGGKWVDAGDGNKCVEWFLWSCTKRKYWKYVEKESTDKYFDIYGLGASELIDIEFIGHDTGSISAYSKGALLLGGNIYNPSGSVVLEGGHIERVSDMAIVAKDLTLKAVGGIGAEQALAVDVSGVVSATSTAGGDIGLDAIGGDLRFDTISTAGDVVLAAQRHLVMADDDSLIRGRRIDLSARSGRIGSAQSAVRIDTADHDHGLFTASAGADVYVNEISGDLRLWQVKGGGDVVIATAEGSILDANTNEVRDERTIEELRALWDEMALTGDKAQNSADAMVMAYERGQEAEYRRYWNLRKVRFEDGRGVADAFDPEQARFDEAYKAHLRENLGLDDEAIARMEAEQIEHYERLHERFGGDAYDPDYHYTLSEPERAQLLDGAVWTEEQLLHSINAAVVSNTSDTEVTIEQANVIGRNVTLSAGGETSSIGQAVGEVVIDPTVELTEEQRLALIKAERDDLIFDEDSGLIRVILQDDVDVELATGDTGAITASAGRQIFLGGEQDLNVRHVQAPVVRIAAGQSIIDSAEGRPAIRAGDLILEAGSGAIGRADKALGIDITGKLTARADQAIHLAQHGVGLNLDYLFSYGLVSLEVDGGGLQAAADGLFQINSGALDLVVSGDVGSAEQPLKVKLTPDAGRGADTGLSANVGGHLYVASPEASLALNTGTVGGQALLTSVGDLSFIGDFTLGGDGDIAANGEIILADGVKLLSATGDWLFTAGGLRMGDDSEARGDEVRIKTTVADAEVATLRGGRIHIDAAGRIRGVGAHDLIAEQGVSLTAGGNIGDAGQGLRVEAPELQAVSTDGDVRLHLLSSTDASQIAAETGAVDVLGEADVTFDRIFAATPAKLDVQGHLSGNVLTAEQVRVEAGAADLQTVTARDDVVITTVGDQTFGKVTSGGDQHLTAGGLLKVEEMLDAGDSLQLDGASIELTEAKAGTTATLNSAGDIVVGTLSSGEEQSLTAGGDLNYGNLVGGADLYVQVDGHVDGGVADMAGGIDLEAGSAALDRLEAERIELRTDGALSAATVSSATTVTAWSGGNADFGSVESRFGQRLHAEGLLAADSLSSAEADIVVGSPTEPTGAVDIDTVSVATDFVAYTRGDQTFGKVTSGGDQHLTAGGTVSAMQLIGANLTVDAGALGLGSGRFAGDAEVVTQGDQEIESLITDGGIRLTSTKDGNGDIVFGYLQSGKPDTVGEDEERLDAPSITVTADGAVRRLTNDSGDARAEGMLTIKAHTIDAVGELESAGADVVLEGAVDVVADRARAKRDLKIIAGEDMNVGEVDYGGELTLVAGRNLWAKVGGDITFAQAEVGGDAELYSGGAIDFESLKVGGLVVLEADGDVNVKDGIEAGESITIRSGADVTAGTLSADSTISIAADGDIQLAHAESGAGQTITAGGDLRFNELRSGAELRAEANGALVGQIMVSGRHAELSARRMQFVSLDAGGPVRLAAREDLHAQRVSLPGYRLDAEAELIDISSVTAEEGDLTAVDVLRLGQADIGRRLLLAGREVEATVRQTSAVDPLRMTLTGHAGGVAERGLLQVDSRSELRFDQLYGGLLDVSTSSDRVTIDDAYVPGRLQLETSAARLVAENRHTAYVEGMNVQLHEQDHQFRLRQVGMHTDTNAYVLRYDAGYTVQVPNFRPSHTDGGPEVRAESALRFTERSAEARRYADIAAEAFLRGQAQIDAFGEPAVPMLTPQKGPAVNLGMPEDAAMDAPGRFGDEAEGGVGVTEIVL